MNLTSDKQQPSLKGVYIFYSVVITVCLLALFVFHLNLYAKAVLCTLILLCILVMRGLKNALPLSPDIDTDSVDTIETGDIPEPVISMADEIAEGAEYEDIDDAHAATEDGGSTIKDGSVIDTYLTLLIETDKELSSDPSIDTTSPSYNNLLNRHIGMKLEAMSKSNNPSDKD